jgi:hypothetical protein
LHGIKRYSLTLEWSTDSRFADQSGGLSWRVRRGGTKEELAEFIEAWVPKCPDPELINEGLAQLSGRSALEIAK